MNKSWSTTDSIRHISLKRSGRNSDTLELFTIKYIMSKMSSSDDALHAVHDLIHALPNTSTASPLVTIEHSHKEALRSLVIYIF